MTPDSNTKLITEQLARFKDSTDQQLKAIMSELEHHKKLEIERMNLIKTQLKSMNDILDDHENRLRAVTEQVLSNKISTSFYMVGQAALTIIASAIAAWLGSSS